MRKSKRQLIAWIGFLILVLAVGLVGCGATTTETTKEEKPTLVLADPGWDSVQFNNSVVQFIAEKGYGYKTEVISGSTPITFAAFIKGDIDIYSEIWTDNIKEKYDKAIKDGAIKAISVNFDDNAQGLYVPTYLIKGNPAKGIKPLAPDLKSIKDLPKYWELFKDQEVPTKGRIYGAPPGWEVDKILQTKIKNYGLDTTYNYFSPGSDAALSTSLAKAYEEGKPWLGYYWEPTWIMGKYDMTLLTDVPFDEALWNDGYKCEFAPSIVTVGVSKGMETKAPDVVEFLSHYKTSNTLLNEALAYMQDNKADVDQTAIWFLKNHTDLWTPWVPSEVADKVKAALK
ncbi:MAG: ABC transporter substrate-binding protein [Desulfosporosinus sp. BRH_c37]|nr:MAG: ABC transporter substrate-binding protein [Desulfosporosinus sp. BRH_c37]